MGQRYHPVTKRNNDTTGKQRWDRDITQLQNETTVW